MTGEIGVYRNHLYPGKQRCISRAGVHEVPLQLLAHCSLGDRRWRCPFFAPIFTLPDNTEVGVGGKLAGIKYLETGGLGGGWIMDTRGNEFEVGGVVCRSKGKGIQLWLWMGV